MPIPQNKKELIEAITENYQKLEAELKTIPAYAATLKELEGHAKDSFISVHNLIAYLIGWGRLVLKWNEKKENNEAVSFPEKGYKWNELGKLAQKFYKDHEREKYPALLKKFDKTVKAILLLADKKTNEDLYGVEWYESYTLGRMIQLNTASPYINARNRLRKWKKEKGLK